MVQEEMQEPTQPRQCDGELKKQEGHFLSARWMVFTGSMILSWISLVPIVWIGSLMWCRSMTTQAWMLAGAGLLVFAWNLKQLRTTLSDLYQEASNGDESPTPRKGFSFLFGMQMSAALACTHLAGSINPIGVQQWFWLPVAGFAGMLLRRRRHIALVLLLTLAISTAHQFAVQGPQHAIYWMFGQLTTSVFIMGCCFAMTQASRQRLSAARMAMKLREANVQLELQADQASMLAAALERNRLAREIHDSVGHNLTTVGTHLDEAQTLLTRSPEQALGAIQKAQRAGLEGLYEIRRSVSNMRLTSAEQKSLVEALTTLISQAERPGLKLTLQQTGISRPLPPLLEISLYRCAQEGVTNACRHSDASEISVHVDFTLADSVSLSVADNGKGFDTIPDEGHGLKNLGERARLLHGEFIAGRNPLGGGLCRMVIPA